MPGAGVHRLELRDALERLAHDVEIWTGVSVCLIRRLETEAKLFELFEVSIKREMFSNDDIY